MFELKIRTGNAAFEDDNEELARILRNLADKIIYLPRSGFDGVVTDINGNHVGEYILTE